MPATLIAEGTCTKRATPTFEPKPPSIEGRRHGELCQHCAHPSECRIRRSSRSEGKFLVLGAAIQPSTTFSYWKIQPVLPITASRLHLPDGCPKGWSSCEATRSRRLSTTPRISTNSRRTHSTCAPNALSQARINNRDLPLTGFGIYPFQDKLSSYRLLPWEPAVRFTLWSASLRTVA